MTQPPTTPPSGYPSQPGTEAYGQIEDAPPSPYLGTGGYAAPDAYVAYGPPSHPTTPVLGRVALAAGVVALLGSIINALIIAALFRPDMFASADGGNMSMLVSLGLAQVLIVWFGFGLWALVQGIIAIVQKRGVAEGVAAVILGLIGPWVGVVITAVALATTFAQSQT